MDAGNMLKPMLARGELHMIGATTLDEYRKYVEKDPALERRFQPVLVEEPSVEDTISILRGLKERYEVHHGVRITDAAMIAAATLSHRYIADRHLPDKAIDLIDEAAARLRTEIDSKPQALDDVDRQMMQLEIETPGAEEGKRQGLQGTPGEAGKGAGRPAREVNAADAPAGRPKKRPLRRCAAPRSSSSKRGRKWSGPSGRMIWKTPLACAMARCASWKRSLAEQRSAPEADPGRGRHAQGRGGCRGDRRGGLTLDEHPGLAPAGRRDAEADPHGRTPAPAGGRAG